MHPATHAVASDVQLGGIKSGLQLFKRFHEEFPGPVWIETPDVGHLSEPIDCDGVQKTRRDWVPG